MVRACVQWPHLSLWFHYISLNQWHTDERALGELTPPPCQKFRSFDKAEPNSRFRGKYIRDNLERMRVHSLFELFHEKATPPAVTTTMVFFSLQGMTWCKHSDRSVNQHHYNSTLHSPLTCHLHTALLLSLTPLHATCQPLTLHAGLVHPFHGVAWLNDVVTWRSTTQCTAPVSRQPLVHSRCVSVTQLPA